MEPKVIQSEAISVKELKKLKENETIEIVHPAISGTKLQIYRDYIVESVLNVPTVLYSDKFRVAETNTMTPYHDVLLSATEMVEYVGDLLGKRSQQDFKYARKLREKNVLLNDVVEFDDGKRGLICEPKEDWSPISSLYYIPLKANGMPSKHQPRIVYGDMQFKVVGHYDGKMK